jgi:hypothetical protein
LQICFFGIQLLLELRQLRSSRIDGGGPTDSVANTFGSVVAGVMVLNINSLNCPTNGVPPQRILAGL